MHRVIRMATVLLAIVALGSTAGARASVPSCTPSYDNDSSPRTQDLAPGLVGPDGAPLIGHYEVPATEHPSTLVVFFHGYGNRSNSWVCHLKDAAINHGAVAVALDYRGTGWTGPAADNRGWFVREGAEDSIIAAKYFLAQWPSITKVGALGISMGGNSSGLAVAMKATRADGKTPVFDYWVDIEGVADLAQEYVIARGVAGANTTAAHAQADIEKECAGAMETKPDCYRDLTLVARIDDVVASGVKGVSIVHGIDDGLVPSNQSRELSTLLRANGIPADQYTVVRRYTDGDYKEQRGTTFTQNAGDPLFGAAGQQYPAPLAGHGWEGSDTQIVIKTGFDAFWNILDHGAAPANHEFVVDSGVENGAPQKLL